MKTDRRTIIKKSLYLTAAAYVAPVTLHLLTATRATAQSASCGTCATVSITNNRADSVSRIEYFDCSGNPVVDNTDIPSGGTRTVSARIGTVLETWMFGADFPDLHGIDECQVNIVLDPIT